jgi:glycerol-3-phosphate acyltransferase PlsY
MVTEFVLLMVGAYLLGSIPIPYLVTKWVTGKDMRQYGSGNVGGANLFSLTSKWIGIPTIVFDFAKAISMLGVAKLIGLDIGQQVAVGVMSLVGQNWPVFLRFSGGRGMMTTLGIAFFLPIANGPLIPWGLLSFFVFASAGVLLIHNVPIGTGSGIAAMPLVSWLAHEPTEMTLGFLAMFLIMIIRRLTAPRTSLSASVPFREMMLNRFLFDRDIRDKEAWLKRQPVKPKEKRKES